MNKIYLVIWMSLLLLTEPIVLGQGFDQDMPPDSPTSAGIQATNTQSITLNEDVSNHILDIYARGQDFGNQHDVFSKVGDSLTVSQSFLYPFGVDRYDLGIYDYLHPIIDVYSIHNARLGNSFINDSLASQEGWSARHVLNAAMSDPTFCELEELPLLCEYRLVRPSIAVIMFGTNDVGYRQVDAFLADMQAIIHYSEELGVIPILSTIPYRPDAINNVNTFNTALRNLADTQNIPIIDLYDYTVGLPNYGLTSDQIHLSSSPAGITGAGTFTPQNLQYGYVVRNLATLDMLYLIYTIISDSG